MDTEGEIWREIPGFENYEISSFGRIRSFSYIKPRKDKSGYLSVNLSNKGFVKTAYIHRLVMSVFTEDHQDMQVNHINCDKNDNRLINLEWCTSEQNIDHAIEHGMMRRKKPVKCIEKNKVFPSMSNAAKTLFDDKTKVTGIRIACEHYPHRTCGGFHFKFIDPEEYMEELNGQDTEGKR